MQDRPESGADESLSLDSAIESWDPFLDHYFGSRILRPKQKADTSDKIASPSVPGPPDPLQVVVVDILQSARLI